MKKQFKTRYPLDLALTDAQGRPLNYCGIRCSLEVLGGKWKLLIVASLFRKPLRYHELKLAIPEISDKMLTSALQELEYHHLVERTVHCERPLHVSYALSAYGLQLRPVIETLFAWGESHIGLHGSLIFR